MEKQVFETPNGHKYTQKGKHVFFEDFPLIGIRRVVVNHEDSMWAIQEFVSKDLDEVYKTIQQRFERMTDCLLPSFVDLISTGGLKDLPIDQEDIKVITLLLSFVSLVTGHECKLSKEGNFYTILLKGEPRTTSDNRQEIMSSVIGLCDGVLFLKKEKVKCTQTLN